MFPTSHPVLKRTVQKTRCLPCKEWCRRRLAARVGSDPKPHWSGAQTRCREAEPVSKSRLLDWRYPADPYIHVRSFVRLWWWSKTTLKVNKRGNKKRKELKSFEILSGRCHCAVQVKICVRHCQSKYCNQVKNVFSTTLWILLHIKDAHNLRLCKGYW